MLTGDRPFQAETLQLMLAAHVNAPTPRLPAEHEGLQPLLDGLMAKLPQDRFAGAEAVLVELQRHGFSRTLPSSSD